MTRAFRSVPWPSRGDVLIVGGVAALVAAAWRVGESWGLATLGVSLIILGVLVDAPRRKERS